jgi:hypothetical protein
MEIFLNRTKKGELRTNGDLYVEFVFFCYTVEDKVREIQGKSVDSWKVEKQTAIPSGKYRVTLQNSPAFGPETITINDVPGFTFIRMHSGNDETHTEGCPLLGYDLTDAGTIPVGQTKSAEKNLKRVIREAIVDRGETVWINIQ